MVSSFLFNRRRYSWELVKECYVSGAERKSSTPLPDYLPEDDVPTETSDKALAPHGITEVASNWISSAATFLQRSFYW